MIITGEDINVHADHLLRATATKTENTVLTTATLRHGSAKGVTAMNKEYFYAICGYKSAMAQARLMLLKGILTKDEYVIIDALQTVPRLRQG